MDDQRGRMTSDHPYRSLYVSAVPDRASTDDAGGSRELVVACGILIAISAIQIASGAQVVAGALGLAGGLAGTLSTRRRRWTTPSSSC